MVAVLKQIIQFLLGNVSLIFKKSKFPLYLRNLIKDITMFFPVGSLNP